MNKNYTSIIVLVTYLFFGALSAQETQKNFINYQGVARNATNEIMAGEDMTIGIALKFGAANSTVLYEENHSITTDANGVFSLLIGNGSATQGNYNNLPWGSAATFVSVSMNGNEVGTTEMMAVPYAISSGNADDQSAAEVAYDNSVSRLSATTAQEAIDELISGGRVDADPDPTNEIQTLSFDAALNKISLTDGGEITIPSGGTDADADPENELQLLSFDSATNALSLSDGNTVTIPSGGTDADADPTNELQDISLAGTALTISGGSTIDLAPIVPPGGTDNQELTFNTATKVLAIEDGNTVDLSSLSTGGTGSSPWSENAGDIYYNSGKVGIGTNTPQTSLSIATDGSNWNLTDTEGDFRIGDASHRLKMSTSTDGAGAGNSRIRAQGGSNRLLLGSGTDDVLTVVDQKVGIGTLDPSAPLDVVGKNNWDPNATEGDLRIGNDTYRLKVGVALGGAGAGDTRIRIDGGTNRMMLGGGANDVLTVTDAQVGVGTITPGARLDVQGDIRSSDLAGTGQRNVMADADGNLVIGTSGGGGSLWSANGTNISYAAGNVGIGTTLPNSPLEIVSGSDSPILLHSSRADGNGWIRYNNDTGRIGYTGMFNGTKDMELGTSGDNPTGKVHLTIGGSPKLSVVPDGNVGIGTQSPSSPLAIVSGSDSPILLESTRSDGNGWIRFNNDTGRVGYAGMFNGTRDMELGTSGSNPTGKVHLTIGGTPKLSVLPDGNVGIGTQSPSSPLAIVSGSDSPILLESTRSDGNGWIRFNNDTGRVGYAGMFNGTRDMELGTSGSNPTGKVHLTIGGTPKLTVASNGDIIVDGSVVHSSDRRLKRAIVSLPYGIDAIMQLAPKAYYWKKDKINGNRSLGLIAQEVEPIIKEVVHGSGGEENKLSISYTELVPVLIKAMQEQQTIITGQSNQISELELRLAKLEAKL